MRRCLPLYLFFLVISTFLQSQTLQPRKSTIRKSTDASRRAGAFVDVNTPTYPESSFSIDQLVKDVLISSGTNTCVAPSVTNVKITPNHAVNDPDRSWGYFHKATTNFPFKDGILLSTGYAYKAGNSFESDLSDVNGGGSDNDLAQATGVSPSNLNDAVLLEFDFIPTTSQIKFNYILASMEYTSTYPCNYADAFAILLKPTSGGPYVNMAVLPAGAGPVSITNIHPLIPGAFGCPAVNEQYFAGYNTNNIETNFNGRTVPLTATATVIPGQEYHFKMVIADYNDHSYDSAVFLEGGSFNIGVELHDPSGAT
ncbi:choice-of-anchor L domain-containing protein, partial [Chryseobacterium sp. PMSZPI]